jgi:hypothetical protein
MNDERRLTYVGPNFSSADHVRRAICAAGFAARSLNNPDSQNSAMTFAAATMTERR